MTSEEAFEFVNKLFLTKKKKKKASLSEREKYIILGFWEGKTYQVISDERYWNHQTVKETGAKLLKNLSNILEVEVNKANFVTTIEQFYKDNSPNILPSQETPTQLTSTDSKSIQDGNSNNNPFTPQNGRVEDTQRFFGREREMQRVFEVLNSGSSVVLIGEEAIGKSSLLWAICQQAVTRLHLPRQPVFLDLNYIDNEEDFYRALCDEVGIPECQGYQLNQNLKKHKNKLLLALDNVGKMTRQEFNRGVRDKLRGLAEGSNAPLKLILAATEPLNDLFNDSHDDGNTSPLAGICQEEHIKPWDETTMRNFIASRLAGSSVSFTEEEIVQLVAESGGHPRELMQRCNKIYARYVEEVQ